MCRLTGRVVATSLTVLIALAFLPFGGPAAAQGHYPDRTVTMIVPFAAG